MRYKLYQYKRYSILSYIWIIDSLKKDIYVTFSGYDTLEYMILINGKRDGEPIEFIKMNDTIVRVSQVFKNGVPNGKTIFY
jgi:hypothetical protein